MFLKVVVCSILLLVAQFIAKILYNLDYHKTVYNHNPGQCRLVPGIEHGSEDFVTLSDGITLITSGLLAGVYKGTSYEKFYLEHKLQGKIYMFDFNKPENNAVEVKIAGDFERTTFFPHGIGVWEDASRIITVFVVSHRPNMDTIDKFLWQPKSRTLEYLESYTDTMIHAINDVVPTSSNSFYFTNSGAYRERFWHMLENVLFLPFGNVVYFDGKTYSKVAGDLVIPNGIAMSRGGQHVYTAVTMTRQLNVYQREKNNSLTLVQKIPLFTAPDNPNVDPSTGDILVGCHPLMYRLAANLEDNKEWAASQVLLLKVKADGTVNTEHGLYELYADDGHTLWGSASAQIYNRRMLIGTVLHKLLYCEVALF